MDALGRKHAEQPAIDISPGHQRWHGRDGRYLLRVTFAVSGNLPEVATGRLSARP